MLLTGLGAEALPYCMVLVGVFIMIVMPVVAALATKYASPRVCACTHSEQCTPALSYLTQYTVHHCPKHSPRSALSERCLCCTHMHVLDLVCVCCRYSSHAVLVGTTFAMIGVLSLFFVSFTTGIAEAYPRLVYPLFFVLEEVIDSLLMVLFWQIGWRSTRKPAPAHSLHQRTAGQQRPCAMRTQAAPSRIRHRAYTPSSHIYMPSHFLMHSSLSLTRALSPAVIRSPLPAGMLCFTSDEAKRLIGIVNMGAAFANLANGLTVAILIK